METQNPRDGDFELVTLRNGARAVRHLGHGDVMHPATGPWQEAQRLYVEQPRPAERLRTPGEPLVIHDVGLGAATNAVAADEPGLEGGARLVLLAEGEVLGTARELGEDAQDGFPLAPRHLLAAHTVMGSDVSRARLARVV